jgi:SHOCT-like domain
VVLMAADPLEQVLRLVAEGRLSADEAAPILAALDASGPAERDGAPAAGTTDGGEEPARPTFGGATTLRIEVSEGGRQVVNLRLPIAIGRFALDRVPGLSGDQVNRVREALHSGLNGPVLEVDDNGDGVRIVLE